MSYTLTVNINLESMDIESLKNLRAEIDKLLAKKQLASNLPKLSGSLKQKMQNNPTLAPELSKRFYAVGCKNLEDIYNYPPEKMVWLEKLTLSSIDHTLYVLKAHGYDYEMRWITTVNEMKDKLRQIKKEKKDGRFSVA
jgi:hypothetical protein